MYVLHALFVNIHTEIIYLKGHGNDNKYLFGALKLNFVALFCLYSETTEARGRKVPHLRNV